MGSALIALGLPAGTAPDAWLLTPAGGAAVGAVHAGHAAAGACVVLTSTFGASSVRLADGAAAGRTADVCRAAVAIARSAVPPGVLIAGDIGPTGALLAPYGELEPPAARDAFAEQAAALAEAGVDLLWVETMADLAEARVAVEERSPRPSPGGRHLTFERGRPCSATDGRRRRGSGAGSPRWAPTAIGLRGRPRRPARACRRARTAAHREGERGRPIVAADGIPIYPAAADAPTTRGARPSWARGRGRLLRHDRRHVAAIAAELGGPGGGLCTDPRARRMAQVRP
jgi:hypothetical protein